MSPEEKAARLAYTRGQMKQCELYAMLWVARASVPGADQQQCLNTCKIHIERFTDLLDHQDELLRSKTKEGS